MFPRHVKQRDAEEPFSRDPRVLEIDQSPSSVSHHELSNPSVLHLERPSPSLVPGYELIAHQPQIPQRKQIASPNAKPHDAHFSIFQNFPYQHLPYRIPAVNQHHQEMTTQTVSSVGVRENLYPDLLSSDTNFRASPPGSHNYRCGFGVTNRATPRVAILSRDSQPRLNVYLSPLQMGGQPPDGNVLRRRLPFPMLIIVVTRSCGFLNLFVLRPLQIRGLGLAGLGFPAALFISCVLAFSLNGCLDLP